MESLSGLSRRVLESLGSLTAQLSESDPSNRHQRLDDIRQRFKLWAGNIGAFHPLPNELSLEHRVRVAPKLKARFEELLGDMHEDVTELGSLINISNDGRNPIDDARFESAFDDLIDLLKESMKCLFKTSSLARKATIRDRYELALRKVHASQVLDGVIDFDRVGDLFPRLRLTQYDWLRMRLAKANNFRRRYLQYCGDHQLAIESGKSDAEEAIDEVLTVTSSVSTVNAAALKASMNHYEDDNSSDFSAFSYPTDSAAPMRYQVIDLGKVNNGQKDFICCYCHETLSINSQTRWKKHVLSDIRAYVCLDQNCDAKLFKDSRSWMEHQLTSHLIERICPFCNTKQSFCQSHDFETHLRREHSPLFHEDQLAHICKISEQEHDSIPVSACPFCDWQTKLEYRSRNEGQAPETIVSPARYCRHICAHLEEAALAVLEVENPDENAESDDSRSEEAEEWQSESEDALGPASVQSTELVPILPTPRGIQNPPPRRPRIQCDECPQEFSRRGDLLRHAVEQHQGLRRFPCPYCSHTFIRKSNLKIHILTHERRKEGKSAE